MIKVLIEVYEEAQLVIFYWWCCRLIHTFGNMAAASLGTSHKHTFRNMAETSVGTSHDYTFRNMAEASLGQVMSTRSLPLLGKSFQVLPLFCRASNLKARINLRKVPLLLVKTLIIVSRSSAWFGYSWAG